MYISLYQSLFVHPSIHICIHPYMYVSIHPSIHPSIHRFSAYLGSGHGGSRHTSVFQMSFLSTVWGLLTPALPGQMRYITPPAGSGSAPGSTPSWSRSENLRREMPWRHTNETTTASSFWCIVASRIRNFILSVTTFTVFFFFFTF